VLSVDFGTSNTVAVLSAHGRPPRVVEVDGAAGLPSSVFAAEDGRLVVGREAERQARLEPARYEPNPKRRVDEGTLLLGDRVVPVTDAFAAVLSKVAGEVSRQLGGDRPGEVRLTHPAQWGPVRRNVLLSSARQAGLGPNLVLVPEPVAAAAHFASFPGRSLAPGQALAVYDLGAGTFDVAAVGATATGFVVLAEAGLPDLGGLDVDQALLTYIGQQVSGRDPAAWRRLAFPESTTDRRAQRALRDDVRAAKEALSGHPQTEVPLPEQFGDVLVTRAELENLVRPNLVRSVQLLVDTVRTAGLTPDRLAGVYLVGGSSRMPLIATLIAEQSRIVATNLDQPESAVALGAHALTREAIALRTDDVPAQTEERTVHIAPPPGPPRRPTAPPRATPPAFPTPTPQPFMPPRQGPPPAQKRTMSRKKVWLIVAASVAGAMLGAQLVLTLIENLSRPSYNVTTEKTLPATMSCTDVIPDDVVSDRFGVSAGEVDGTARCDWAEAGAADDPLATTASLNLDAAAVDLAALYDETFVFEGNDAARMLDGSCEIVVAIQSDELLELRAYQDAGDSCALAEELLAVVFDNLPDG
jgi:actin-like ATPase involved in cell morphogenesis